MGATNRPDVLDSALLRPGRFDRLLYVPPPDLSSRKAIFEIHTRAMPLHADVDLDALASVTAGYTGADIAAVCQQAAIAALEQDANATSIMHCHFEVALSLVQPSGLSLSRATNDMYESFRRRVA